MLDASSMKSFLSYPSEQLAIARAVYDFLCSIGVRPWFDKESLIAGQDWDRERQGAQRAADLTFLVLSPETVTRQGVIQREVKEILELLKDKPLGHIFLVSLRTKAVPVPPEFLKFQYIDYLLGWESKLARAVALRFDQLGLQTPTKLTTFLQTQEREQRVQFKALRFHDERVDAQTDYFVYQHGGDYWDYVNAEIISDVVGGFLRVKGQKVQTDRLVYWQRKVEEHFRQGDLISLRISAIHDFGGAYPNYGVYTKNFGGPDLAEVRLEDLFDHITETAYLIHEYCNQDIKRQRPDHSDYDLPRSTSHPWAYLGQWGFSSGGLHIWLSELVGLPHAFGILEVVMPWVHLKPLVSSDFHDTSLGRFILSRPESS
jgi:hypothetical protein